MSANCEKWTLRTQIIHCENKPLMRTIFEFIGIHPPPARNCEIEVYRKYVSKMAFFANCIYTTKDGRTNAEKNIKYDLSYFDLWQRLDITPFDIREIRKRLDYPTDANVRHIRKWAEKYPEDEGILDFYAEVLSTGSRFIEADEVLQQIEKLYPEKKSHDGLNSKLHMKIRQGWDLEGAALTADVGLAIYPKSFDFIIAKAEILKWLGDETGCRSYLKVAESLDKKRFVRFMKNSWIDEFPEELRTEQFMHTMNEIMILINSGQKKEGYALLERAKRLCPNLKELKTLLLHAEFSRAIDENRLADAEEVTEELKNIGNDEVVFFSEAVLAYKKGDRETAVLKALDSKKIASKKKVRYFLPSLELLKMIYRERNDQENEKMIKLEIKKALEYIAREKTNRKQI